MNAEGRLVWLDLCSGLGGASQPALDRGWKVIRIDIDPRFKPDIVADVRALPLKPFHVDVLWASPPCQQFSKFGLRCFYPDPPKPDLSISRAIRDFIDLFHPAMWIVENVRAARPFLNCVFGPPRVVVPGHAFWSDSLLMFPNIAPHKAVMGHDVVANWSKRQKRDKNGRKFTQGPAVLKGPKRYGAFSADAAKIPYEIGEAICLAVERRHAERGRAN